MSLHIITIHNIIICVNVFNLDVFTSNWHFYWFYCNFCAFEPNCYVYKSYIVYFIKLIYSCVAIYMGLYCIWQSCLSSCRTLWVCFSLGFCWCFFSSVLRLCRLASVLLRCRLFLPEGPSGSNTITVESLMSQLI